MVRFQEVTYYLDFFLLLYALRFNKSSYKINVTIQMLRYFVFAVYSFWIAFQILRGFFGFSSFLLYLPKNLIIWFYFVFLVVKLKTIKGITKELFSLLPP